MVARVTLAGVICSCRLRIWASFMLGAMASLFVGTGSNHAAAYEAATSGSGSGVDFYVMPGAVGAIGWLVPYGVEPNNRIDGHPYNLKIVPQSQTNNYIDYGDYGPTS